MAAFDWKTFSAPFQDATPEELGIPESPCKTCLRAAGDGCHKPVDPSYQTSCRKWDAWFRESWPIVTGAIRGTRK